jgi:tellurite resistance protein
MSEQASELQPASASHAETALHGRSVGKTEAVSGWRQLDFLPISLFGSVMGLTGLSVAWRLARVRYDTPDWLAATIAVAAVAAFVAVTLGYMVKLATAPDAVRAEFHHPIAGNLFATFLISLLLLPIIIAPVSLLLAQAMWIAGAAGTLGFAWTVVNRWMSDR